VDAHGVDAALDDLLVEGVHELLVVEPPVRALLGGEERIADRVALPAVGLEAGDRVVDLVHPAALLRREDRMAEQAPRVGDPVHSRAGGVDVVVGEEVPVGVVEGRAGQQRHLRIAVDEDLLHVVLELEAREVVLARQRRVPVLLGVLREAEQPLLVEVVAHEVGLDVDDELSRERAGAVGRHAGLLRFRGGDVEEVPEHLVHGEKGGGHPGAARQELAAAEAVPAPEVRRHLLDAGFDLLLLARLRQRIELTVGNDLCRHG
jgi:hypothetical protein